jgi:signal transduction histidine kinase/CheY-like chemotaxis protein
VNLNTKVDTMKEPKKRRPKSTIIFTIVISNELDLVLTRQRARQIAELLGFKDQDLTRIATAVSEIARNAFIYGGEGKAEFLVEDKAPLQMFLARISDKGPGIDDLKGLLDGQRASKTGMGLGIIGARRLMDYFHIESAPGQGTTVLLGKTFSPRMPKLSGHDLVRIAGDLERIRPYTPLEEIQKQNQELLRTLEELTQLNRELEDTNRGVVALYTELDEKAERLHKADELKSRFLSHTSHELRSPLNSILSLSRILLNRTDGELTAEQERQVGFIQKATEHLSEMINELLDLAKIEAGKMVVRTKEFEVEELFGTLRGLVKPLHVIPFVELIFENPVGIPLFNTDDGKVMQILRNLIANALKFTEQGEIRVSAAMDPGGHAVIFSVADTGIGISPDDQERIFEEYVQIETPLQKQVKGTGLGLPLSRKLAELLGGSLSVTSEKGVGSTFTAVIPLVYEGILEKAVTPLIDKHVEPKRLPVLVVEDEPSTMFIYEIYLKGSPFRVIPAYTVKEARQALRQVLPAAIILDILLPEEDGWDFLTELKQEKGTRDIPVLVVTIIDDQHEKGMILGADDYCVKPVDRSWLLKRLQELDPLEKIMIVDDEESARYMFKKALEDTPYILIEAADGPEGIRRAREEQPQVIFLDLLMPGMSGFEVLERLKSDPATRAIPVIIYTSKELEEEERLRLSADAAAILFKRSTSRQMILARIKDILDKVINREV